MDYENSGGQIQEIQNVRRQEYEQLEELREKEAGVQAGQIEIFQAVLGQIDQVLRNTGYLEKALDGVMNADDCSDTLQAIVDIVQARETTISRMVDSAMSVLEKMLEIRNGEK